MYTFHCSTGKAEVEESLYGQDQVQELSSLSPSCPRRSAPLHGGPEEAVSTGDAQSPTPSPNPGCDQAATTPLRRRLSRDRSRAAPPSSPLSLSLPAPGGCAASSRAREPRTWRGGQKAGARHIEVPRADLLSRSPARERRRIFPGTPHRLAEAYCACAGALAGRHTWVGRGCSRTRAAVPAGCGELGVVCHC